MPGVGILAENESPVVLVTGGCSQQYERDDGEVPCAEGCAPQVHSHLLCGRTKLSHGRATKEAVRALFSELQFDSVQLNRKDAVTSLRVVQGGLLATASRIPRAHGKLE